MIRRGVIVYLLAACFGLTHAATTEELNECAAITDMAKRVQCYDALATREEKATEETDEKGAFSRRLAEEREVDTSGWAILPHRLNYILPVSYSTGQQDELYREAFNDDDLDLDNVEIKFQLSFKFPLWENMLGSDIDLMAAYTQISLWQAYNNEESAAFRENNYEPEVFIFVPTNYKLLGLNGTGFSFSANHQSNGRNDPISRSWNRLIATALFERRNFAMGVRAWWRIPENGNNDNPNTNEYYGHGEIRAAYKWKNNVFGAMLRNNMRSNNRTTYELGYSIPITRHLKIYAQWFDGWGESLIDYDNKVRRIGAGILLTDWL